MKLCTPSVMESYFEMFGWNFKVYQSSTWKAGESEEASSLDYVIHMTDSKIKFEVSPFLNSPVEWDLWPEATLEVMEIKERLQIISLNLSEAGDLTLSCEVLRHHFDYENFCNTAEILEHHAEEIRQLVGASMRHSGLHYFQEPTYFS
jgi:hypothetical protein